MIPILFLMLLACGEETDPKWLESGTYSCVTGCDNARTFTLTQTGTISNYELTWESTFDFIEGGNMVGECIIGDPLTPDESAWDVSCDGLEKVTVYSNGFEIEVEWYYEDEKFTVSTFQ